MPIVASVSMQATSSARVDARTTTSWAAITNHGSRARRACAMASFAAPAKPTFREAEETNVVGQILGDLLEHALPGCIVDDADVDVHSFALCETGNGRHEPLWLVPVDDEDT